MFALSMAVDPGRHLHEALGAHGMTHDEAWREMGYRNAGQFSKALDGSRPLDERKLDRLPWPVWIAYVSKRIADRAQDFGEALRSDHKRMARAELKTDRKEGAA